MGYSYFNEQIFLENQNKLLLTLSGDVLSYNAINMNNNSKYNFNIENFIKILKFPIVKPIIRLTVLNRDETVNYVIPNEDIV